MELAGTAKTELDTSIREAGTAKTALDESTETAGTVQETLSATVKQAGALDTSLGEKIETGAQLKTDLVASGKKAVQDIQNAGSEQLGKMQAVAEEFTADREQITINKEDIGSLKEDLSNKITKFYASNQGETHLADSDNGKIMDMMLYGRSEQKQYRGKNLLPTTMYTDSRVINGVTFINNGDGSVTASGTATDTTYFDLWGYNVLGDKGVLQGIAPGDTLYVSDCLLQQTNSKMIVSTVSNRSTSFYDSTTTMYVTIRVTKGESVNKTFYPQIEKGSEATSYEPYVGGQPSPSPNYPQRIKSVVNPTVKVYGKNILPSTMRSSDATMNGITFKNNDDGSVTVRGAATDTTYFGLWGYKALADKGLMPGTKNGDIIYATDCFVQQANKSVITSNSKTGKVEILANTTTMYVSIYIKKGENVNKTFYPQISFDQDPTYKPYREPQTVQLPYTLNAIPVASGGNVTIDGQQYVSDKVVEKDGVFGIERNTATDVPVLTKGLRETSDIKGRFIQDYAFKKTFSPLYAPLVNIGYGRNWGLAENVIDKWIFGVSKVNFYISPPKDLNYTSEDIFNALKDLNIKVYGALSVSIFEPLPGDIQAKLRTIVTNYPGTNISVTSDQLDGYTVFNYPISMANGWNYVKKQLGDTRDYIYDMDAKAQDIDIQSAEAYVNSEYAVALTELEVM